MISTVITSALQRCVLLIATTQKVVAQFKGLTGCAETVAVFRMYQVPGTLYYLNGRQMHRCNVVWMRQALFTLGGSVMLRVQTYCLPHPGMTQRSQ